MNKRDTGTLKSKVKWRWLVYALIGVVFGIIDYYIQLITVGLNNGFVYIVVAFGVWLIPAIPIIVYEIKTSGSKLRSAIACILTWVVAVFVYYTYILFRLMFIGQESMKHLHISNSDNSYYWQNISNMFFGSVLGRIEWFVVAVLGGLLVGLMVAVIYKKLSKKPLLK